MNLSEMGRAYHAWNNPPWPFVEADFLDFLDGMKDVGFVKVTPKGFLVGYIAEVPVCKDWRVARQVMWWGDGDLIRAFRKWAEAQGANEILHGCVPESRVERHYAGFSKPSEIIYSEVI